MEVTIHIAGLRAVGRHGVLPEEQERAQPFEVHLSLTADVEGASSDRLSDTIDYGVITEAIARVVELESYRLLERLADRIASVCSADQRVRRVEVTVRKLRPPIPVDVCSVAVTVARAIGQR